MEPNFYASSSKNITVEVVPAVFGGLAVAFFASRIITKAVVVRKLPWNGCASCIVLQEAAAGTQDDPG